MLTTKRTKSHEGNAHASNLRGTSCPLWFLLFASADKLGTTRLQESLTKQRCSG